MHLRRCKIPAVEWIDLYTAAERLSARLSLFSLACEEMIERAVLSGDVPVRGMPARRYVANLIPTLITKNVRPDMGVDVRLSAIRDGVSPTAFTLWDHVEIIWPDCAVYCERNLKPYWVVLPESLTLEAAIAELLDSGVRPGQTMLWPAFCDAVRDRANGWISKPEGKSKRGFGNRTIERLARQQTDKTDKVRAGPAST
jgi:hypothetical protein